MLLPLLVLGIGLVFLHQAGVYEFLTSEGLRVVLASYGVYAPLVFIGLYAVATVTIVPGAPLTLLSGALFGPVYGTIYTVVGATIGATAAFLLIRWFKGPRREQVSVSPWTARLLAYNERIQTNGFITVLILRLIPLFPFSALNYGLGLSSVRTRDYVLATFFGIIPGTFAYTYFGSALAMLHWVEIVLAVIGIIGLSLGGRYLAKHYRNHETI